jgi:hypothetical protein
MSTTTTTTATEPTTPPPTAPSSITPTDTERWARVATDEKDYNDKMPAWLALLRMEVTKTLFPRMQFTPSQMDEDYGSAWQRACCHRAKVPNKFRQKFWSQSGMRTARMLLNRRRQNTTLAMKTQFKSKRGQIGSLYWCWLSAVWIM